MHPLADIKQTIKLHSSLSAIDCPIDRFSTVWCTQWRVTVEKTFGRIVGADTAEPFLMVNICHVDSICGLKRRGIGG